MQQVTPHRLLQGEQRWHWKCASYLFLGHGSPPAQTSCMTALGCFDVRSHLASEKLTVTTQTPKYTATAGKHQSASAGSSEEGTSWSQAETWAREQAGSDRDGRGKC